MSSPQLGTEASESAEATRPTPGWVVPLVVVALVVGLAGLGVGIYAVAKMPAKTSGPRGPVGPAGATGEQGPQGVPGPVGAAGPAGTIASASVVEGTAMTSAPSPPVGTVLVAQTSCPAGKILMSGGAQVAAAGAVSDRDVVLRSSFPLTADTWETVALVSGPIATGVSMSMKPYVVCGTAAVPASTTTTTTPTT